MQNQFTITAFFDGVRHVFESNRHSGESASSCTLRAFKAFMSKWESLKQSRGDYPEPVGVTANWTA